MPRKTPHTSTNPGKRVRLVLRDGTRVESRFKERTGRFVVLDQGRYTVKEIERFIVVKDTELLPALPPPVSAPRKKNKP